MKRSGIVISMVIALLLFSTNIPYLKAEALPDNGIYLSDFLLSDLSRMEAYTGLEKLKQGDISVPGLNTTYDGEPLLLHGVEYAKGIGMHSNDANDTALEIDISGLGYTVFTVTVGMHDHKWEQEVERNTAAFIVLADDKVLYESDMMTYDMEPEKISVNIAGASKLSLCLDFGVTPYSDNAIWADAILIKDPQVTPAPTPEATDVPPTSTPKPGATGTLPANTPKDTGNPGTADEDSDSYLLPVIIAIVSGAVIIGGIVYFIKRKK